MMVAAVEMERWRSYFGQAGADIWTVIQHAINIAAMDYPSEFRERRGEIAETLFARNLATMQSRVNNHDHKLTHPEELDLRVSDAQLRQSKAKRLPVSDGVCADATRKNHYVNYDNGDDSLPKDLHSYHVEVEPIFNETGKDALLTREINGIKADIVNEDQPENAVVEALQRLQSMQITVGALKATGIGKQLKVLKKHPSKMVRDLVKELVRQWKFLVDEWANSTMDGTAAEITIRASKTETGGHSKSKILEERQPLLRPDEGEQIELGEVGAPSVDLSKLFSFVDRDLCTEDKDSHRHSMSVEPSVKDNLNYLSGSQSGSLLTDSSDFDTKASTNYPWGHRTPEERGSATRDVYPPLGKFEKEAIPSKGQTGHHGKGHRDAGICWGSQPLKATASVANPVRQSIEVSKGKHAAVGKPANVSNGLNSSHVVHKSAVIHVNITENQSAWKSDKDWLVDQKLEIAKRKLHQGYQQAENAKKQRVIQVLDFPEGAKAESQFVKGKGNWPVQNKGVPPAYAKTGFQNSHASQSRRF